MEQLTGDILPTTMTLSTSLKANPAGRSVQTLCGPWRGCSRRGVKGERLQCCFLYTLKRIKSDFHMQTSVCASLLGLGGSCWAFPAQVLGSERSQEELELQPGLSECPGVKGPNQTHEGLGKNQRENTAGRRGLPVLLTPHPN